MDHVLTRCCPPFLSLAARRSCLARADGLWDLATRREIGMQEDGQERAAGSSGLQEAGCSLGDMQRTRGKRGQTDECRTEPRTVLSLSTMFWESRRFCRAEEEEGEVEAGH